VAPPALHTAGAAPTAPAPQTEVKDDEFIGLNFDYADINTVIQTISGILNLNYILAPGVSGKVTIQTSGKIAVADLFFVLEKILEVNNLTAVKSDDYYKIIPLGSVTKEAIPILGPGEEVPRGGLVIKIFKLSFMAPSEVAKIFGGLKSPQGIFLPHDAGNILFMLENPERLAMFTDLIQAVDVDLYRNISVEMITIVNAQAEELAKDLTQIIGAVVAVPGRAASKFKLVPIKSINAILWVTAEPGLGDLVKKWVRELDQKGTAESEKVFVYALSHASADNVAGILRELYAEKGTGSGGGKAAAPAPAPGTPDKNVRPVSPPVPQPVSVGSAGAGIDSMVSGKVKIVSDKDTNSLIIQTAPWNYASILETIRKLDRRPEQVLIEVTIAELSLDDSDSLGLEWALLSGGQTTVGGEAVAYRSVARNVFNTTGAPSAGIGFSYLLAEANRVTAVLNAYAKASKLNIISRPHIVASDNKEAKIDVGQEVPVITSTKSSSEGTQTDQTIEYRSTGVILTVTPRINEDRDVTLDVAQEVSQAQTNKLGGTDSPIISKRTAKTSMVVRDNETLIIGGLIQEKREKSREGIPLLSRLPLLGYLFGTTVETLSKTELIVMITPRVITSSEDATRVTSEFRERSYILKKSEEKK
jgi:general secretion pathway protein D